MKEKPLGKYGYRLLLGLLPAVLFLLYCGGMKALGHPVRLVPSVKDEMFWYHQISAVVKSGRPLGYYGYDGGQAPVGTFGPWGIAVLLPYALFGKIFGWTYYSMSIANVVFFGTALCAFAFLCRLSRREALLTGAAYAAMLLNIRFSVSCMAEALRWSIAIILLGCVIRIYRGYAGKVFTYLVTPLLLVFSAEAYLLSSLFIPVYFMEILPVKSFIKRGIAALFVSMPVIYGLWRLLLLVESGYKEAPSQTSLIRSVLQNTRLILKRFTPGWIWQQRGAEYGFLSWYILGWLLFFLVLAALLIRAMVRRTGQRREETAPVSGAVCAFREPAWYRDKERMRALLGLYLMAGTLAGFCVIYSNPSTWTIVRGIHTVEICAALLLCLTGKKRAAAFCVLLGLISFPSFIRSGADSVDTRYQSEENMALIETAKAQMEEVFDIAGEHPAWENTIALYGDRKSGVQTALTLAMPEDAGYNVMFTPTVITAAKYAVIYRSFKEKGKYREMQQYLTDAGYHVVWKHKKLMILSR